MALPLERRLEGQSSSALHLLPSEGSKIVDTSVYPLDLTHHGWRVKTEKHPNGHADAVSYHLSRVVTNGLNTEELGRKIGIVDENGNWTNGYSLSATPTEEGAQVLNFTFDGVPTGNTRDVIVNLAKEFLPEHLKARPILIAFSSETNASGLRLPIAERLVLTTIKLPK